MCPAAAPAAGRSSAEREPTVAAGQSLSRRLFKILFYAQLLLVSILTVFLTIRGFLSAHRHHFHPSEWYRPLLSATAGSAVAASIWHWLIQRSPRRAVTAAFWLSPVLALGVGALLLCADSVAGLVIGVISVISAVSLALYGVWVNPRFEYASKVISVSSALASTGMSSLIGFSVAAAVMYLGFTVCGIGGATAVGTAPDMAFIVAELLSLTWTMHVIKNALQVTVSRIGYLRLVSGVHTDPLMAFRETAKYLMGSVSIGSILVPVSSAVRGLARTISTVAGGADEFLFSCADCYSGMAAALTSNANRWGFVHVGAYNKEFVQASRDTWDSFRRAEMEALIDSDLTGVFCFLCGVTGGAVSALVAGSWALAVHRDYATEIVPVAFLIGYLMCRVAVAGAQACVSAYYVAYSENPQNPQLDPAISVRLEEMKRHQNLHASVMKSRETAT